MTVIMSDSDDKMAGKEVEEEEEEEEMEEEMEDDDEEDSDEENSDEEEEGDSDKELQIAFKKGTFAVSEVHASISLFIHSIILSLIRSPFPPRSSFFLRRAACRAEQR